MKNIFLISLIIFISNFGFGEEKPYTKIGYKPDIDSTLHELILMKMNAEFISGINNAYYLEKENICYVGFSISIDIKGGWETYHTSILATKYIDEKDWRTGKLYTLNSKTRLNELFEINLEDFEKHFKEINDE